MLHPVSGNRPEFVDLSSETGTRLSSPVRGPLVAEIITSSNISTATNILHRCFRDQISKREINQCLQAFIQGETHVQQNSKMNLPGFEILAMFIFRNSIRQPVAVGGLRRTEGRAPGDISLLWIGVAPEHRRRGYGSMMLRALEDMAIERYCAEQISLCTDYEWEGSAPARAMYERYGFKVEQVFPIFWGREECLQAWYMKKACRT